MVVAPRVRPRRGGEAGRGAEVLATGSGSGWGDWRRWRFLGGDLALALDLAVREDLLVGLLVGWGLACSVAFLGLRSERFSGAAGVALGSAAGGGSGASCAELAGGAPPLIRNEDTSCMHAMLQVSRGVERVALGRWVSC